MTRIILLSAAIAMMIMLSCPGPHWDSWAAPPRAPWGTPAPGPPPWGVPERGFERGGLPAVPGEEARERAVGQERQGLERERAQEGRPGEERIGAVQPDRELRMFR